MSLELPYRHTRGFDALYGLVLTEVGEERMCGQVAVTDDLKQGLGLVHGGVHAAIAESLASWGTMAANQGKLASGLSNQTSFLRPVTDGTIHAIAIRKHGGRTTSVWEVELYDDQRRLCVLSRVTVAIREPRGSR